MEYKYITQSPPKLISVLSSNKQGLREEFTIQPRKKKPTKKSLVKENRLVTTSKAD